MCARYSYRYQARNQSNNAKLILEQLELMKSPSNRAKRSELNSEIREEEIR